MSKIIRNFKIVNDNNIENDDEDRSYKSVEPIIKIPIYNNKEKEINTKDLYPIINEEPRLQLMKNTEGVVVGIEVHCKCGEKILIRLDYKL